MTPEQKDLFIETAQTGIACGLKHRYEWYMNIMIHAMNLFPYDEITKKELALTEAFLEFEIGTAGSPEEEKELQELTVKTFYARVHNWYKAKEHPLFQNEPDHPMFHAKS